jgi:hypothetical protein
LRGIRGRERGRERRERSKGVRNGEELVKVHEGERDAGVQEIFLDRDGDGDKCKSAKIVDDSVDFSFAAQAPRACIR